MTPSCDNVTVSAKSRTVIGYRNVPSALQRCPEVAGANISLGTNKWENNSDRRDVKRTTESVRMALARVERELQEANSKIAYLQQQLTDVSHKRDQYKDLFSKVAASVVEMEEAAQTATEWPVVDFYEVRRAVEWHEDDGEVLWHKFPIQEPPYLGTPLTSDLAWVSHTLVTIAEL